MEACQGSGGPVHATPRSPAAPVGPGADRVGGDRAELSAAAGPRPGGWRTSGGGTVSGGTGRVTGSPERRVTVLPWWTTSRVLPSSTSSYVACAPSVATPQAEAAVPDPEPQPGDPRRQPRGEDERAVVVAHPAEPGDQRRPGPGEGGDVQPVAGVVLQVVQVHERGLARVVVREVEAADLGREHRLRARRQRGVPHGDRLVVGEVRGLLLRGEGVPAQLHGEHEVGLLADLPAVEVEVRVVEHERVLADRGREVPRLVPGEPAGLLVDTELGVERQRRRRPPAPASRRSRRRRRRAPRRRSRQVRGRDRGGAQVPLRHEQRVDVVVGDGRVLVGPGDAVDVEAAVPADVTQAGPQPGRLDEQLEAGPGVEVVVADGVVVADDGVRDVGVDVEGRRPRRPVARSTPRR